MTGPTNVRATPEDRGSSRLPTGTVTFLFTDIEGSTRLLQERADVYPVILAEHRGILDEAFGASGGVVFGQEGDAVFAAFAEASAAVRAAAAAQRALAAHAWPHGAELRVRMGIHTGDAAISGGDYVGLPLHQVARITTAAHGGQVIVSATTRALASAALPGDLELADLGEHRLKDLTNPERLFELRIGGLERAFPPPRTLDTRPNNLPVQLTSFVGREELEVARGLLGRTRLLTLTGPGGTGKTRLALQIAAEALDDFPDGACFVPLDTVVDPDLIPSAIASAMAIETGTAPPLDRVLDHLRGRRLLLVLDNFEQVLDGGPTVGRVLAEAAGVKVIVTSRIPLRISGEQEFGVPPLGLPAETGDVSAESAGRSEAVRLFVERALATMPSFALTDDNAPALVDIVMKLDGLPLAIELAAARVRILPVEALRARLADRLGILVGGPRDRPARQQTLRGAIDWSYELLDEPDRLLFERFAVFTGGACLSQAEAICGPSDDLGRDVLDGLASLAEKSLLRPVPGAETEPRFAMLVTIREYAIERLEAHGAAGELRRRHAEQYLGLVEGSAGALTGTDGGRWLDRLELDHDNLRAALDWAEDNGEASIALRFVVALWRFWQVRGHLHEARARVGHVLAMAGVAATPVALQARAYGAAGSIAYWRGEFADQHRFYSRALELARESGDRAILAEALFNRGFAPTPEGAREPGYQASSRPYFLDAQAIYRELGDLRGIANASWALATAATSNRDWPEARRHADEAHDAYRALGDGFGIGWTLHELGLIATFDGDLDAAEDHFREAVDVFRGAADVSALVLLLLDFVSLAGARGELDRYWRLAGAADGLRARTGVDLAVATGPVFGLEIPVRPGDDPVAQRAWDEGLSLSVEDAIALALRTAR